MYMGFHEEGDGCPEHLCNGRLHYVIENCSCHISAPCSACTNSQLTCNQCDWEDEAPEFADVAVAPGLSMREYKPRPLDSSKIDYRSKMHTNFTMIKEGVYPKGSTKTDVREVVDGTFGGRFEHFGGGKFKFIAYTD